MSSIRFPASVVAAIVMSGVMSSLAASPSMSDNVAPMPPFQPHVDMKTFMEHVLSPAATIIWRVNGVIIDEKGEHDLSPQSDDDWEKVVSGAATLAEATDKAYRAAEAHDLKSVSEVSDQLDGICAACHRHYGFE